MFNNNYFIHSFLSLFVPFTLLGAICVMAAAPAGITPIPMELLNPRLTEFRRIDSNNDDALTFAEYLQSDRPWMETLSRRYHQLDLNSDGRVTRKEFEAFFRGREEAEERQRAQADNFFKQLTVTVGPIVEREQIGNASNGASRTRYFSAGARKFSSAIAQGTGLFPSAGSAVGSIQPIVGHHFEQPGENSAPGNADGTADFLRDHDQHFRLFSMADFPHGHSSLHNHVHQPPSAAFLSAMLPNTNSPSEAFLPPPFLGNRQNNPNAIGGGGGNSAVGQGTSNNAVGQIVRPVAKSVDGNGMDGSNE